MSDPRRPDPVESWQHQFRARTAASRERLRNRLRRDGSRWDAGDELMSVEGERQTSLALTVLLALGSAVLALGTLWAWQTWSQRSGGPVDDLLPRLVETAQAPEADASTADVASPTPGQSATATPEPLPTPETQYLVVHVSGAVGSPGVVELAFGSRVFEAVALAGGAANSADLDRINLAAPLVDGERIHVPAIGEELLPRLVEPDRPVSSIQEGDGGSSQTPLRLDINLATAVELEALPGIGPATGQAIVTLRQERGPFFAVAELLDVPGIGDAKLALLEPHVFVAGD